MLLQERRLALVSNYCSHWCFITRIIVGKETAKALLKTGNYYVICACRDVDKMVQVAKAEGFDNGSHTVMKLDLASFQSVKDFVFNLKAFKSNRPLDVLVCNAAVYQPALPYVSRFLESYS